MRTLKKFLKQQNAWNAIVGGKVYDADNLTPEEAQEIADDLDMRLSPENLSCDGELGRAEVNARYRLYTGAVDDLRNAGFDIKVYEY